MPFGKSNKPQHKAFQLDADFIRAQNGERLRRLDEKTIQMCIATLEYQRWATRWKSTSAIDPDEISRWVDVAVYELLRDIPLELPEDEGCTQYEMTAPFLAYAPNDPFSTPDYVP